MLHKLYCNKVVKACNSKSKEKKITSFSKSYNKI